MKVVIIFIAVVIIAIINQVLNKQRKKMHELKTVLDTKIPFIPLFIYPYLSFIILIPIITIFMVYINGNLLLPLLISFVVGCSISFSFFYFFQTYTQRPTLEIKENKITLKLIRQLYKFDNPYNCFPSTHVLYTTIITLYVMNQFREFSLFALAYLFAICFSTLTLKQHYLLDVIFGIFFGILAFSIGALFI